MQVYLDNSATTKPCAACVEAIHEMLTTHYGNPSSLHGLGIDAMKAVMEARQAVAAALGTEKDEIVFTSGGTEANNLAVLGAAHANRRKGNRIVTTAIEHESVLQSVDELEKEGFEVIRLQPDSCGRIAKEQINEAVNSKTILITMMLVNNEVGSVLPTADIRRAVKRAEAPALIHIDCVQGFGKIPIRADRIGADLMTVTAHKIHGPKGIGALYIRKSARILPRTFGGEQEKKIRPGTEAAPLIAGFGAAINALPPLAEQSKNMTALNTYAKEQLSAIAGIQFNSGEDASPYIINLYVPTFMRSQTIIQELSANYGICVSSGSACAKGRRSHVLTAMKLPDEIIDKSIRISFSRENTRADVDALCTALRELIQKHPKET